MHIVAGIILLFSTLCGTGLTLMTLPGVWLIVASGLGCRLWQPDLFSIWTFGIAIGLAVLAEIAELLSSAAGTSKAGGGKAAAASSVVGAIVGAIAGTFLIPIPIIGTIAGGVIGAGLAAMLAERRLGGKAWSESAKVGGGAAAGRLVATVIKAVFAVVIGLFLATAAFIR